MLPRRAGSWYEGRAGGRANGATAPAAAPAGGRRLPGGTVDPGARCRIRAAAEPVRGVPARPGGPAGTANRADLRRRRLGARRRVLLSRQRGLDDLGAAPG